MKKYLFSLSVILVCVLILFTSCNITSPNEQTDTNLDTQSNTDLPTDTDLNIDNPPKDTESDIISSTDTSTDTEQIKDIIDDIEDDFVRTDGVYLELSEDGTYYTVSSYNFHNAEYSGELKDVIIPEEYNGIPITQIGIRAFQNNIVDEPGSSMGYECKIRSVTLSKNIQAVKAYAFTVSTIENIYVDEENPYFTSIDGNLYTKDKKTLVSYAIGKKEGIVELPNGVEEIGAYSLAEAEHMAEIILPASLTTISKYAFIRCHNLMSIAIPQNVNEIQENAFLYCSKIYEIYNHSSIKLEIGSLENGQLAKYAMAIHTSSEEKSIFTNINDYLFVTINEVPLLVGYKGNENSLILPESYNGENYEIYQYAFIYQGSFEKIYFPETVTKIGINAFYDCSFEEIHIKSIESWMSIAFESPSSNPANNSYDKTSLGGQIFVNNEILTELTVSESIKEIKPFVFYYCRSLKSVTIGNHIEKIGEGAFWWNRYLETVKIGDGVKEIGPDAFYQCASLTDLSLGKNIEIIKEGAFRWCSNLTELKLPSSLVTLEDFAFSYCDRLESVTMGENLYSIGNFAFFYCDKLISVEIGKNVYSIGEGAFEWCEALEKIIIPLSVQEIGAEAFTKCDLLSVYCEAEKRPSGWRGAFADVKEVIFNYKP